MTSISASWRSSWLLKKRFTSPIIPPRWPVFGVRFLSIFGLCRINVSSVHQSHQHRCILYRFRCKKALTVRVFHPRYLHFILFLQRQRLRCSHLCRSQLVMCQTRDHQSMYAYVADEHPSSTRGRCQRVLEGTAPIPAARLMDDSNRATLHEYQ